MRVNLQHETIPKLSWIGSLIRRCFVSGAFVCVAVVSSLAQIGDTTRTVVVTLLLTDAQTTDPAVQKESYLAVAASGGVGFQEAKSWLYFNASALPSDIQEKDFIDVQLQLTPKTGAERGMAITVMPAKEKSPEDHSQPLSYSPSGNQGQSTLVSPPLPTNADMLELRSDSASLTPGSLLLNSGQGRPRYIGLLLLPQPNASRRLYYGLNSKDDREPENHPARVPRLIITYSRKVPPIPPCATEPSALALIQSDARPADTSSCNFLPKTDVPANNGFYLFQVAANVRTKVPVSYLDRLYAVRKVESVTRLEELDPLGGLTAFVPLDGEVRPGSPMFVDAFGRLRIITNDAIFTAQLGSNSPDKTNLPASVDKKAFDFGQVPETVIPGPDGTLYVVKQGIFALNPEVGELDKSGKVVRPERLWKVATGDENSTRITLGPDGHFLYVLARFVGNKSRFAAINAQTGKDVQLPPADFPDDLNSFRNPVVARGLKGVDLVYITGDSGSGATLWAVSNDPVTQNGDLLARFGEVWKYPLEKNTAVGQPILDPTATPEGVGLINKKVYFLQSFRGGAGTTKLTAVSALDGTKKFETPEPTGSIGKWSTDPVVDSAGNLMFWASDTLFGFTPETKSLFAGQVVSSPPQLLFGPSGTLYTAYGTGDTGTTVNALIPSFQQSDAGPTNIYSPSHLYVTGSAARQAVKPWTLGARGSVMLGDNFSVKLGETLTVRVNANQ